MDMIRNKYTIEVSDSNKTMVFDARTLEFLGWFDVREDILYVTPHVDDELKKCLAYKYNKVTNVTETTPFIAD